MIAFLFPFIPSSLDPLLYVYYTLLFSLKVDEEDFLGMNGGCRGVGFELRWRALNAKVWLAKETKMISSHAALPLRLCVDDGERDFRERI